MNDIFLERISRYAFIFLAFILPIFVLPYTIFPLEINKTFLFYGAVIIAALLWLISILQKASFQIPKSSMFLAMAGIVAVWMASSLFSGNFSLSFIGGGQEVGTAFSLILLGISSLLVSIFFRSKEKALAFYLALFGSGFLVFIFQIFRSGFNITLLPWDIFTSKISNTVGSWNELGIFFGFIALSALVFIELSNFRKWMKMIFFVAILSSLFAVAFINFTTVWIILGIFSIVFLVFLLSIFSATGEEKERKSPKLIRIAAAILLLAVFFIMARTMIGDFVSGIGLSSVDVRPTWVSTWQIVKGALKDNFLLGSGPNTFIYDWLRFKPLDINSTPFWSYIFKAGSGLLPSWIAVSGFLGGLALLVFLVFIIFYGLKIITYSENETTRALLLASFFGSLYLWIFTIIYPVGFLIISLAFLVTGLFIALLCYSGKIKVIDLTFSNKPKVGFLSSLIIVLLMIGSVASLYLLFQKYLSAYYFNRGLIELNATGNIDKTEDFIGRASRFDQQDQYYRALSQINLTRLQQLVAQKNLSADEARTKLQNLLSAAIGDAQTAISLNSFDFQNWLALAQVYEAVIPFKIPGAGEAALSAYKEAVGRAPLDPRPLFYSARVAIQSDDLKSARSFLESAIGIKGDFTPALFLLSQLEAQEGNLKEAINRTEQTFYLAPNDIGVVFQLGLLYYQDKNYAASQAAFERAINLDPNYSNARYFLGLIYDRGNKKEDAIAQFKQIQSLNPDNQEVKNILSNLAAGKPALDGISPPQLSPEKRQEPPIKEENAKIEK